jgi:hypothetical protein
MRIAEFVIHSQVLTTDGLADRLGVTPDSLHRGCWVAEARGDDHTSIDTLVEEALRAAEALWPRVRSLVADGEGRCLLRVVAYLGSNDATGAGFALSAEQVRKLADVSAELDVDLYGV